MNREEPTCLSKSFNFKEIIEPIVRDQVNRESAAGFRFGLFELDSLRLELRRDGVVRDIEPKPLEVLVELVRAAGEVVTHSDLMDRVWGGRPVTDHVLTRCINRIRAALGDEAQSLIQSVYGQGYRFTSPVIVHPVAPLVRPMPSGFTAGEPVPARPHWRLEREVDRQAGVWLAIHEKTRARRIFKFALTPDRIPVLQREVTVYRFLSASLGEAPEFSRLVDFQLEAPPYAMELEWSEEGSLPEWLERHGGAAAVPFEERLALIASAAEGLARAHSVGVLHLDVKPANMLVWNAPGGGARIRWTDFGSGRLLDPDRLDDFGITRLAAATAASDSGTLSYIAPEVIAGHPPTVQSDIYALGVVLYQIVCGDLRRPLTAGWEADIADPLVREDIASAANGDPARRLGSAMEMARRIRSLADRRAEAARSQAQARETADLARRLERMRARRPWFIGATLTLALALMGSLWAYREVRAARDKARIDAATAIGVRHFFEQDVLGAVSVFNPEVSRDITVREAIDRAVDRMEASSMPPLVEAQVRSLVSYAYIQQSRYAEALREDRRAIEMLARLAGPEDPATVAAEALEPEILLFAGRYDEALAALDRLDRKMNGLTDIDPEWILASAALRGAVHFTVGRYPQALPHYRRALELFQKIHPGPGAALAARYGMLARTQAHLGDFGEAGALALRAEAAANGEPSSTREPALAIARLDRGVVAALAGRDEEALQLLESAHDTLARLQGADVPEVLEAEGRGALLLARSGRADRALANARHAHDALVGRLGAASIDSANALARLGSVQVAAGRGAQGIASLRSARDMLSRLEGRDAPDTALATFELARALWPSDREAARSTLKDLSEPALALAAPSRSWEKELAEIRSQRNQIP